MPSTEWDFFHAIHDYVADRYRKEIPTSQALEGLIVGYLAGSQKQSVSVERLLDILGDFSRLETGNSGPYSAMYKAAQELILQKERIIRPQTPIDW
ncbi:hypothetical protein HY495_01625 [Candidatus Woesearchaeota archaeon]|nr:hypothetical protein [Candidatus Woesearchaeota archaeon]